MIALKTGKTAISWNVFLARKLQILEKIYSFTEFSHYVFLAHKLQIVLSSMYFISQI